jgi:hypothetical protein
MIEMFMPKWFNVKNMSLRGALLMAFLVVLPVTVAAQTSSNNAPQNQSSQTATPSAQEQQASVTSVQTTVLKGRVLSVSSQSLTIKTDTDTKNLPVGRGVKITRDGSAAALSSLKPDDQVTATLDQLSGAVISVDVSTGKAYQSTIWMVGAAIAAIIIVAVLLYLYKKSSQPHIKTTTTKLK